MIKAAALGPVSQDLSVRRVEIPITCMQICLEVDMHDQGSGMMIISPITQQKSSLQETLTGTHKKNMQDGCVGGNDGGNGGNKGNWVVSMELLQLSTLEFVDRSRASEGVLGQVAENITSALMETIGLLDPCRRVCPLTITRILEAVVYGRQDSKRVKMIGMHSSTAGVKKKRKTSSTSLKRKSNVSGGEAMMPEDMKLNGPLSNHTFISTICLTVVCYLRMCPEWPRQTLSTISGGNQVTEKSIMAISADLKKWFSKDTQIQDSLETFMQETSSIWMYSPNSYLAKYTEKGLDVLQMYTSKGTNEQKKESLLNKLKSCHHQTTNDDPAGRSSTDLDTMVAECLASGQWFHLGNFIRESLVAIHDDNTEQAKVQKHPFRHIMHALPGVLSEDIAWKVSVACMFNQVMLVY